MAAIGQTVDAQSSKDASGPRQGARSPRARLPGRGQTHRQHRDRRLAWPQNGAASAKTSGSSAPMHRRRGNLSALTGAALPAMTTPMSATSEWQAAHTVWLWADLSPSMMFKSSLVARLQGKPRAGPDAGAGRNPRPLRRTHRLPRHHGAGRRPQCRRTAGNRADVCTMMPTACPKPA